MWTTRHINNKNRENEDAIPTGRIGILYRTRFANAYGLRERSKTCFAFTDQPHGFRRVGQEEREKSLAITCRK
jgi:hypothetical protein